MKFNQNSHEIFRKWYVDGRIYFHKVVDSKKPQKGMVDIRNVDPLKIKKVRNVEKDKDNKGSKRLKRLKSFMSSTIKVSIRVQNPNEGATLKIA